MQPTRAAWMRARTDKAIRIGLIARHPQQKPHQLKTMQQNAMKEAIPVVILVILIHVKAKNKDRLSTFSIQSIHFYVARYRHPKPPPTTHRAAFILLSTQYERSSRLGWCTQRCSSTNCPTHPIPRRCTDRGRSQGHCRSPYRGNQQLQLAGKC